MDMGGKQDAMGNMMPGGNMESEMAKAHAAVTQHCTEHPCGRMPGMSMDTPAPISPDDLHKGGAK